MQLRAVLDRAAATHAGAAADCGDERDDPLLLLPPSSGAAAAVGGGGGGGDALTLLLGAGGGGGGGECSAAHYDAVHDAVQRVLDAAPRALRIDEDTATRKLVQRARKAERTAADIIEASCACCFLHACPVGAAPSTLGSRRNIAHLPSMQ